MNTYDQIIPFQLFTFYVVETQEKALSSTSGLLWVLTSYKKCRIIQNQGFNQKCTGLQPEQLAEQLQVWFAVSYKSFGIDYKKKPKTKRKEHNLLKAVDHGISGRHQDPAEYGPPGLRVLACVPLVQENLHVDRDGDDR